jgi:hypothetical protein
VLLELKGLEEVTKYSSPSPLLLVKLISVWRRDSSIILAILAACSLFRLQLRKEVFGRSFMKRISQLIADVSRINGYLK